MGTTLLDRVRALPVTRIARGMFDTLVERVSRFDRRTLAWAGLALGAVTLLSVNLIASSTLKRTKVDLTEGQLFSISPGTRKVLSSIDEPVSVNLYYSRQLGELAPAYGKLYERVRTLLEQYRDLSRGRLQLQVLNPEPFSDAEDRAVAGGLTGVRLNREDDRGYFGLLATNSTDNEQVVPFFSLERERFLEYDLTKIVWQLANPKKRAVGLVSGLPLEGGMAPPMMGMGMPRQTPPWAIVEQIREFFEVKPLGQDIREVPKDIEVLMVVQPDALTEQAQYAIDQFVLGGGRVLAFVDPVAEMGRQGMPPMPGAGSKPGGLDKLLAAWGVKLDTSKVVGDIKHARQVQFGAAPGSRRPVVTEYVAWLGLAKGNIEEKDVLSGGIERLNIASAGALEPVDGAKTLLTPIVRTSDSAALVDAERVRTMPPDAVGLLRTYKPGGKKLTLVARVSGEAASAFPNGPPPEPKKEEPTKEGLSKEDGKDAGKSADGSKADENKTEPSKSEPAKSESAKSEPKSEPAKSEPAKSEPAKPEAVKAEAKPAEPAKPHVKGGRINVVLVADTDLLHDQFWVDVRELLGQQVMIPTSHNAVFVVNALDNLSGGDALLGLRGRGVDDRPFTRVDEVRRDAERRFREKEEALQAKLKNVEEQLANVVKKGETGPGNQIILSDKDKAAIESFRREMVTVRGELREVKHALRKDIDRLDGWTKFLNIAGVPLLIGLGGLAIALRQRRQRARL